MLGIIITAIILFVIFIVRQNYLENKRLEQFRQIQLLEEQKQRLALAEAEQKRIEELKYEKLYVVSISIKNNKNSAILKRSNNTYISVERSPSRPYVVDETFLIEKAVINKWKWYNKSEEKRQPSIHGTEIILKNIISKEQPNCTNRQNVGGNAKKTTMEQLITSIYQTLEDYRADENRPLVRMTTDRIRNWINQFDEGLQVPILTELDNIFKKRYCSKSKVKDFLDQVIKVLTKDFGFKNSTDFLKNSDFLNLQPDGKSQRIMLSLFDELIQEKHGLSLTDCGTTSKKYSIYIDDILCTGLTLISDIKDWSEKEFFSGRTNNQAVADGSTILVFAYVFIHEKNYHKKKAEMRFKISNEVSNNHKMYRLTEIENGTAQSSKIDLIYPLENGQPQSVIDYKNEIVELVDIHTQQYNQTSSEEFYRPAGLPTNEQFFTSAENRIIVENVFLQKGIEILHKANANNRNMRALGYSIPSHKNFGFGALCFTWRNVPNNAPLVFWYSGGGFTPLFIVTRGGIFFLM